jgi:hypothetical protein
LGRGGISARLTVGRMQVEAEEWEQVEAEEWEPVPDDLLWEKWSEAKWNEAAIATGDGGSFGGGCGNDGGSRHSLETRADDLARQEVVVEFQKKTLSKLTSYLDKVRADLEVREAQFSKMVEQGINERLLVIQKRENKNTDARLVEISRSEDKWKSERDHMRNKLLRKGVALEQSRRALEVKWGAIAMEKDEVQRREEEVQTREDEAQRREAVLRNVFGNS